MKWSLVVLGGAAIVVVATLMLSQGATTGDGAFEQATQSSVSTDRAISSPSDSTKNQKSSISSLSKAALADEVTSHSYEEQSSLEAALNSPYLIDENETNPRTLSVLEAKRTGKYPERLSMFHKPKPFDEKAWREDPASFLNVVEPGRIEDFADATHDPITVVGPKFRRIKNHEVVTVQFQTEPHAPVSAVCTRGGIFTESKVSAATVQADDKGIATLNFWAPKGVVAETQVIAASPMTYGQAVISLYIETKMTALAESASSETLGK